MEIILQIISEPICYAYAEILECLIPGKPNKALKYFLCTLCFLIFSASVMAVILGIIVLIGIIEINTPLLIYIIVGTSLFLLHIAIVVIAVLLDKKNNDDELKNKLDIKENEPVERYTAMTKPTCPAVVPKQIQTKKKTSIPTFANLIQQINTASKTILSSYITTITRTKTKNFNAAAYDRIFPFDIFPSIG